MANYSAYNPETIAPVPLPRLHTPVSSPRCLQGVIAEEQTVIDEHRVNQDMLTLPHIVPEKVLFEKSNPFIENAINTMMKQGSTELWVVVMDTSSSMNKGNLGATIALGARAMLSTTECDGKAFIIEIQFNSDRLTRSYTQDDMKGKCLQIEEFTGRTNLYDAIISGLNKIDAITRALRMTKASLHVITDGKHYFHESEHSQSDVRKKLAYVQQRADFELYTSFIGSSKEETVGARKLGFKKERILQYDRSQARTSTQDVFHQSQQAYYTAW
jgi:hypothetical protein